MQHRCLLRWKFNRSSSATLALIQLRFTYTKSPYPSSTHSFNVSRTNSHEDHSWFPGPDLAKFGYLRYTYSTPLKVKRKTICTNRIRSLRGKHNKEWRRKKKIYSTVWMHYQDTVEDVAAFSVRKNRGKVLRNKCLEISWQLAGGRGQLNIKVQLSFNLWGGYPRQLVENILFMLQKKNTLGLIFLLITQAT